MPYLQALRMLTATTSAEEFIQAELAISGLIDGRIYLHKRPSNELIITRRWVNENIDWLLPHMTALNEISWGDILRINVGTMLQVYYHHDHALYPRLYTILKAIQ